MEKMNKMYLSPEMEVIELMNESILCQSRVETGGFSLGDSSTIGKGNDSDWNNNGGW